MSRIKLSLILTMLATAILLVAAVSQATARESFDAELKQKIRRHIEQNMVWPAENMRMEFLSALPSTDDLTGKITYSIESRSREEYIGDTSFALRIFVNGIFVREANVRVRIEVLRDFVVALTSITRDSIVQSSDVTVQKKWVRNIPMNSVSSVDDVLGKSMVIGLRPNTMITRTMFKDIAPVRKGKMVQVIVDNGAMKMMMNGIAEEDGANDNLVRIRNINSNKIIYARVIGQGKVQVEF